MPAPTGRYGPVSYSPRDDPARMAPVQWCHSPQINIRSHIARLGLKSSNEPYRPSLWDHIARLFGAIRCGALSPIITTPNLAVHLWRTEKIETSSHPSVEGEEHFYIIYLWKKLVLWTLKFFFSSQYESHRPYIPQPYPFCPSYHLFYMLLFWLNNVSVLNGKRRCFRSSFQFSNLNPQNLLHWVPG